MTSTDLTRTIQARLRDAGLDLVQAFDLAWYNERIAGHPRLRPLETFGRANSSALALLVGNTRALWPRLRAALATDPQLRASTDPVDDYAQTELVRATGGLAVACSVYPARERGAEVSLLHAAEASGFAAVGPAQLGVHRELGPWFGLRGLIVLDVALERQRPAPDSPCATCSRPCVTPLSEALAAQARGPMDSIAHSWPQWLAVRDACPVGREHRYGPQQLAYHYTKDRSWLGL